MRSWSRLRTNIRAIGTVTRRVIGVPDYERYLAHLRQCHPGERPVSRKEFSRQRLEEKYSRPGARCC
ncbi:MAG: YbdD/YjiX family protein [Gemmatimonadaceae bacterium]|nr:YbdD/YjiX family protein [Gemmatimonadaceae bacterium]